MAHTVFEMLREGFKGFGAELLADIRQSVKDNATAEAEDAARYQWELGVEKSVAAMLDLKTPDDKIIAMLQKHWDFRLSEAERYLKGYKEWKLKQKNK